MAVELLRSMSTLIVLFPIFAHHAFARFSESAVTTRSLQSGNATKVRPFQCSEHSGPLQTLWGKEEYYVNERTLNGNTTVYTIPRDRTNPPYEQINACGINPTDDILYCMMNVSQTTYLVRIDDSMVEYVAKMPSWSWTAAFSSAGTFYFAYERKYYRVEKASELVGYADQKDSGLRDLSQMASFANLGSGADMVVVNADVEGTGADEYIMTLANNGKLRVTRATGQVESWLLQSKPELDKTHSYGAAWAYQNRVFFSQNKAGGMYEVFTDSIDLVAGTVNIEKVGPSFESGGTDGANCINIEIPSKFSGKCGPKVGAYSAITKDDPFPPPGAKNVRPDQELIFLPDHDETVTGYQVFLGPAVLNSDGSVASVEWHLACNLPCGVNVCKPPYGLDSTLGGNFAWRVDQLKVDGSIVQGAEWQFSLIEAVSYSARAVADTYIDKKDRSYGDKRHMLMRSKTQKNPQFGFVKFNLPPPTYAGVKDCNAVVMKAELRLTVLSVPMKDVMVYLIPSDRANSINWTKMTSATGKHPGSSAYPDVFNNYTLVNHAYGPVAPGKNFTIDVTDAVSEAFKAGLQQSGECRMNYQEFRCRASAEECEEAIQKKEAECASTQSMMTCNLGLSGCEWGVPVGKDVSFGLETSTPVSRFCAQASPSNARNEGWCYPRLEMLLGLGDCQVAAQDPSCSMPADSAPGPLDAMCGDATPTFPGTPTDWRDDSAITTTTTTTTTTQAAPIKEGQCRYNDHVSCPWPHSDTMCSGDQCCPDGSTCPSATFAQAQGCNLKKYDCTAPLLPANWTCRESEEVFCPGTDVKCSGNTCCPNNTTCPSASVMQAPSCGEKSVDCQAPLSKDATCAIGEYVTCPGSTDKCFGNQCCPDGSTCPSAPDAIAEGCGPKKASCELLTWSVKLRVTSIIFDKLDNDTKDIVETLSKATIAAKAGLDTQHVSVTSSGGDAPGSTRRLKEDGMTLNAEVSAPGGWSQKKLDNTVESNILSENLRLELQEMMSELDGLQEASSGEMALAQLEGGRADLQASGTETPESSDLSTQAPSAKSTSLRGGGDLQDLAGQELSEVTSTSTTCCFLPALLMTVLITCSELL